MIFALIIIENPKTVARYCKHFNESKYEMDNPPKRQKDKTDEYDKK